MAGNNGIVVQDRDRHLLRELAVMRVIDREQAKCVAGFHSTTRANARLLALTRVGLLRRFFMGTAGSGRKALYALAERGAILAGAPYRGLRRAQGLTVIADFFVIHQLQANEILCTVKYRPIPIPGVRFLRWVAFHKSIEAVTPIIPDGYFELGTPSRMVAAFLEVDLGHESRSVWRAKVQAYVRYAASGSFEREFSQGQFRTLVVAPSERRLRSLRETTADLTHKIFWFTTPERIATRGFWSAIWDRPAGGEPQPLLTLP